MSFPSTFPEFQMDPSTENKFDYEIDRAKVLIEKCLDDPIQCQFISDAFGVVFLNTIKTACVFGINCGKGFVVARIRGGWSCPLFLTAFGLSAGVVAGGETIQYIVVLNSRGSLNAFLKNGQINFGPQVDIAFGNIGRAAAMTTNVGRCGVGGSYAFSFSKGLYGGLAISTDFIINRSRFNRRCYGKNSKIHDILNGAIYSSRVAGLHALLDKASVKYKDSCTSLHPDESISLQQRKCENCELLNDRYSSACKGCNELLIYSNSQNSGNVKSGNLVLAQCT